MPTFAAYSTQDGVYERCGAALATLLRQIHRIVYDCRCGNARQVQQLEHRHPENVDNFRVEPGEWPLGECRNDVVESPLPAERPRCDLGSEGAIAFVRKRNPGI